MGLIKKSSNYSGLKSIQKLKVSFANVSSKDVTISAVDTKKSIIFIKNISTSGYNICYEPTVEFKSSSSIQLKSTTINPSNSRYEITIYEFDKIKSIQSGTISVSMESTTINISPVNINKCLFAASASSSYSNGVQQMVELYSMTSTTLDINLINGTGSGFLKWTLIELI